jgi:hypothetical protein
MRISLRLTDSGIRTFQKFCACSVKLLYRNSRDDAISISFAVLKFPNGAHSNVGIRNNNPLVTVESRKHNMIMLHTAIVPIFTLYISFKSSNQIDVKVKLPYD